MINFKNIEKNLEKENGLSLKILLTQCKTFVVIIIQLSIVDIHYCRQVLYTRVNRSTHLFVQHVYQRSS